MASTSLVGIFSGLRLEATQFVSISTHNHDHSIVRRDDPTRNQKYFFGNGELMQEDGTYICDACGEEIVVPLDISAGAAQQYVEDCPVCCRANVVHVELEEDGFTRIWAHAE